MCEPRRVAAASAHAKQRDVPHLETRRLILRAWRRDDAAAYMRIVADEEVMRHIGTGWRYRVKRLAAAALARLSDVEARRAIARMRRHWRTRGFGEWAVEDKATGTLLGQVGFVHHADWRADRSRVEVGWMLTRSAWGRGFASEAATAALAHGFDTLALERIVSITRPENVRSERVMQRIGLAPVGRTRWKGGAVIWYALDRATWCARRDGTAAQEIA